MQDVLRFKFTDRSKKPEKSENILGIAFKEDQLRDKAKSDTSTNYNQAHKMRKDFSSERESTISKNMKNLASLPQNTSPFVKSAQYNKSSYPYDGGENRSRGTSQISISRDLSQINNERKEMQSYTGMQRIY